MEHSGRVARAWWVVVVEALVGRVWRQWRGVVVGGGGGGGVKGGERGLRGRW